ncbi:TatD family hydrolase [Patescibacteria group bacterium]|nr:TatD family hydrolase [Patescibacteria group bacterium]MBU2219281.1 TatD family hydrolase [Patescibacteria group bacterium]
MNPKLFDIHAHVNFKEFDSDREEVIKRALDNGIWIINVGSDYESSKKAVEIADAYAGVYAAVGIHPTEAVKPPLGGFTAKLKELAKHPKVVAIGECGLDLYRRKKSDLERQKEIFIKQIEMALELNKPLMIHCRDAHDDLINILATYYSLLSTRHNGNIHFFSGTWEQAQKYFDLGFSISFTGVLTYDVGRITDIVSRAPVDKIMVETDTPFVAPLPRRGQRNEPFYVQEVAKKMAEIRGISYEELAKITTQNALRLFFRDASV